MAAALPTVWIVMQGEINEGGHVLSAHATEQGALLLVQEIIDTSKNPKKWSMIVMNSWSRGCDVMWIEKMGVNAE